MYSRRKFSCFLKFSESHQMFTLGRKRALAAKSPPPTESEKLDFISPEDFSQRFNSEPSTKLGAGGTGEVHRCYDSFRGEEVAVKVVTNESQYPEILHEIEVLKRLKDMVLPNEHIVNFFEAFEFRNNLNTEFVNGGFMVVLELGALSLHNLVASFERAGVVDENITIEVLSTIARSLVSAISQIHSLGIIHFDVKPSNVVVTRTGQVKLCDFGSAVQQGENKRSSTAFYMSPEFMTKPSQVLLKDFEESKKSDIWSIGVTLLHTFCGVHPFLGRDVSKKTDELEHFTTSQLSLLKKQETKSLFSFLISPRCKDSVHEAFVIAYERLSKRMLDLGKTGKWEALFLLQDIMTNMLSFKPSVRNESFVLTEHPFLKINVSLHARKKSGNGRRLFLVKKKPQVLETQSKLEKTSIRMEAEVIQSLIKTYDDISFHN